MTDKPAVPPPVPRTLLEYVRSFGPGIVVVLTWLGAGTSSTWPSPGPTTATP
ncbi:MAG: hypothetical protein QM775_23850 [Pirellulales bacterium]